MNNERVQNQKSSTKVMFPNMTTICEMFLKEKKK